MLVLALSVTFPASLWATGSQGTESPFAFGAGAREIALGSASIAHPTAAIAPYWNPAYLARAERLSFLLFHSQLYESDVTYQYAGLVFPTLDYGTFGAGLFRLGVNNINMRDVNNFDLGETSESRLALYLSYGKNVSGFDVGFAVHLEQQSLADVQATSSPAVNIAISRSLKSGIEWMPELTAVLSGRNIVGEKLRLDEHNVDYPVSVDAAITTQLLPTLDSNHKIELSLRAAKVDMVDPILCAGIEYGLYNTLFLRGGVRDQDYSVGAGLHIRNFEFDYSLTQRDLGSLHLFNLVINVGGSRSDRLLRRKEKEATRFNQLMRQRLTSQSKAVIDSLTEKGQSLLKNQQYEQANLLFDRALFLARSSESDTTVIARLSRQTTRKVTELNDAREFEALLDSTKAKLSAGDLIAAKYFVSQAATRRPESEDVKTLQTEIDNKLAETESTQKLVRTRLAQADSLLSYGQTKAAIELLKPISQIVGRDKEVDRMLTRAFFESWKEKAQAAMMQRDYRAAQSAVDSAQAYFPNHPWCAEFQARLKSTKQTTVASETVPQASTPPTALSGGLRDEVEQAYEEGRKLFEAGNLEAAVKQWEKVERLAPDYEGVRSYLTRAYKFVGVKLYGQDQLEKALDTWRRALQLTPNDSELKDYIDRTERELVNLKELSYEAR